jgi:8-oxo-dGTP pyrophosphatase MutT (NUDIX family)
MKSFRLFVEAKDDNPKMAAGVLFYAPDTKKYGAALRSAKCDSPHTYGPVGGSGKGNETPKQACCRETDEEIKFKLNPKKLTKLDSSTKSDFTYHTFLYKLNKQTDMNDINLNDENDDFVWFDINNPPKPLHPGFAKTLEKNKERLENLSYE